MKYIIMTLSAIILIGTIILYLHIKDFKENHLKVRTGYTYVLEKVELKNNNGQRLASKNIGKNKLAEMLEFREVSIKLLSERLKIQYRVNAETFRIYINNRENNFSNEIIKQEVAILDKNNRSITFEMQTNNDGAIKIKKADNENKESKDLTIVLPLQDGNTIELTFKYDLYNVFFTYKRKEEYLEKPFEEIILWKIYGIKYDEEKIENNLSF